MAGNQEKYYQVSSTLDKYTRISKNTGNIHENEIRVKSSKETKFYVGYALHMLEKSQNESIVIKATGNAIPKAVNVVEILKRRVEGLHQINRVRNVEVEDTYEPLEEGLDTVIVKRYLSLIEVTLAKKLEYGQNREPGYQEPLPETEINTADNKRIRNQVRDAIQGSRARRPISERNNDRNRSRSPRGGGYRDQRRGGSSYRQPISSGASYGGRGGRGGRGGFQGGRPRDDDRGDRGDRSDRADRGDRGERADRGDRGDRGDRAERGDRGDREQRSYRDDAPYQPKYEEGRGPSRDYDAPPPRRGERRTRGAPVGRGSGTGGRGSGPGGRGSSYVPRDSGRGTRDSRSDRDEYYPVNQGGSPQRGAPTIRGRTPLGHY